MNQKHNRTRIPSALMFVVVTLTLLASLTLQVAPAHAAGATITVNTTDGGDVESDGNCSLYEAVNNANSNAASSPDCAAGTGADFIVFADSLGTATISQWVLLPTITDDLTIDGGNDITIDLGGTIRLATVNSPKSFSLLNIKVQHGFNVTAGGAVYINGGAALTIQHSTLFANSAGSGGAVYNAGAMSILDSTFDFNTSGSDGAGVLTSGPGVITNSTFSGNASGSQAGAVVVQGSTTTITNSTFSGNSAASGLGASIDNEGGTLHIYNTITEKSISGDDCVAGSGTTDGNNNLIEDSTPACGFANGTLGNIVGVSPQFGGMTGSPAYFTLSASSPAIDAGDNSKILGVAQDESEVNARKVDDPFVFDKGVGTAPIVDMGASERQFDCSPYHYIYVDQTASGDGSATSWANATHDLQIGLAIARDCVTGPNTANVLVAQGVYKPDSANPGDPTLSFNIPANAEVIGGIPSGGGPINLAAHPTILSGDLGGDDVNVDGNNIDESYTDIVGTNSYHVVYFDGRTAPVNVDTLLDFFYVTGGNASVLATEDGGGIYCDASTTSSECGPTLAGLVISGNRALGGGGGMVTMGTGSPSMIDPVIENTAFSGNHADGAGGGLLNVTTDSGHPVLSSVTFLNNSAGASGGGMVNLNGGITSTLTTTLSNVTFSSNSAVQVGGGMWNFAENMNPNGTTTTMNNVTFSGNAADKGGAIENQSLAANSSTLTIWNTILWGDSATTSGNEINNEVAPDTFITLSHVVVAGGCPAGSSCANLSTSDPKLSVPANNGGQTETMALQSGSSAIDSGEDLACGDFFNDHLDQRAVKRPQGAHCDIGAYESIPARASLGTGYATNVAVFRPSTGGWFVKGAFATAYGVSGDDPLPYDFNGDGVSDVAVYRPSSSGWFVKNQFATLYGLPGDVPVPGDYDDNKTADVAVYRPSTSAWYVKNQFSTIFGLPGDIPVPGDYNGDGTTDIAVYRPSTSAWYIRGQFAAIFGLPGDIPVPGDYNGDGITDLAVFRPSTNSWFVRNQFAAVYGVAGDIPAPGDYDGNGTMDIAVYRPSSSGWFVKNQFSTIYGIVGDYPLPAPDTNADGDPYQ